MNKSAHDANAPSIDFDHLATEDEARFRDFKIYPADYLLVFTFFILFSIVFLQFFTRYVLNDSLSWTEEAARYLLIILSFAAGARCQYTGSHIVLEFVDTYYGRALPYVKIIAQVLTLIVLFIIIRSGLGLIEKTQFQQMLSLPFPKYYLYAGVVGMLCTNIAILLGQTFFALRQLTKRAK